ncbi:MAG: energy transducer TonB [Bdellovibrionales bacterium]|nr:energy transducer TonB [Bdellovibrionales bacterium]
MRRHLRSSTILFLIGSALLHLLSGVTLYFSPDPSLTQQVATPVEVDYRTEPESKTKNKKSQQIVEQKKQINSEEDPNAKYLSAFNQKILQQTRSAQAGKFNNNPQSESSTQHQRKVKPTKRIQKNDSLAEINEKSLSPKFSDIKPQFNPAAHLGTSQPSPTQNQETSATDDYLKDLSLGPQTLLSTREYIYYSYYNRIKEKIKLHWETQVKEKISIVFRHGRTIASNKDHITQVVIVLNKEGRLIRVEILSPSGVQDLDQAAIDAFQSAEPFPNPPKGLVEKDGLIRIRWDFVLEASHFHSPAFQDTYSYGSQKIKLIPSNLPLALRPESGYSYKDLNTLLNNNPSSESVS